jgi:fumarate reductase flavoprotein subunit
MISFKADVVIVGAGLAGLRAAIEVASRGLRPAIISLIPSRQSHSNAAQGGIQASLANIAEGIEDDWEVHFRDTVKGSDWGADQNVVEKVCKIAPRLIRETEYWGAVFSRTSEGKINQRPFGGTTYPRCAFASDGTGHILLNTLDSRAMALNLPIFIRRQALSLINDGKRVYGVSVLNIVSGETEMFVAPVVILAAGGAGQLFRETTNGDLCYGDGMTIALETGIVPIGNPEFIQFHPTPMPPAYLLATEGCRGDGGVLLNKYEKEFMREYAPNAKGNGNLASRDVVSRSMMREIKKGNGIDGFGTTHLWLDIKRLGENHIRTNLADVDFLCRNFIGVDPTKQYIPVKPAHHYTMFGVKTDENCAAYGLEGLYAAGECACWDMHGANRLGGNSLLETLAAGYVSGVQAVEYIYNSNAILDINSIIKEEYYRQIRRVTNFSVINKRELHKLFKDMKDILSDKAGIFRNGDELLKGIEEMDALHCRMKNIFSDKNRKIAPFNPTPNLDLQLALRLPGMIKLAYRHYVVMKVAVRIIATTIRKGMTGSGSRERWLIFPKKAWSRLWNMSRLR